MKILLLISSIYINTLIIPLILPIAFIIIITTFVEVLWMNLGVDKFIVSVRL